MSALAQLRLSIYDHPVDGGRVCDVFVLFKHCSDATRFIEPVITTSHPRMTVLQSISVQHSNSGGILGRHDPKHAGMARQNTAINRLLLHMKGNHRSCCRTSIKYGKISQRRTSSVNMRKLTKRFKLYVSLWRLARSVRGTQPARPTHV